MALCFLLFQQEDGIYPKDTPKNQTKEHQQLVDHRSVDMITRDNCSLSLIISAGGAVNISSMENIFRTEAAWYKELRGVISSSSCI